MCTQALSALWRSIRLMVCGTGGLGRTMEDCVSRVAELLDRDIHVRILDGRVDTKGLGKMVVGLLAAAAEIERDLLLERALQRASSVQWQAV